MAAITVHPFTRTRSVAPARPAEPAGGPTVEATASDAVPGPDERSLARTTAVVVVSLALLTGTLMLLAFGAGSVVNAVTEWFFSR